MHVPFPPMHRGAACGGVHCNKSTPKTKITTYQIVQATITHAYKLAPLACE